MPRGREFTGLTRRRVLQMSGLGATVFVPGVAAGEDGGDDGKGRGTQPGAQCDWFDVQVVDAETGDGVADVELVTTGEAEYVTDDSGRVALNDPGLMGQNVWFTVNGQDHCYPPDWLGFEGLAVDVTPGGETTIEVESC